MKKIIRALRKKYAVQMLISVFSILTSSFCAILFGFYFFTGDDGFGLIPFILSALYDFFSIWFFCNRLGLLINPLKSDVFKKYGSVERLARLLQEIELSKEFDDGNIIISRDYVVNPKDAEGLIACSDVTEAHMLIHKLNFVIDQYQIVITDKFNTRHYFTYGAGEETRCGFALDFLKIKCTNAQFGSTKVEHHFTH